MKMPSKKQIAAAKAEIAAEDEHSLCVKRSRQYSAETQSKIDRSNLPSEHPDHVHGMMCDGQDGMNSYCDRLRRKLFGDKE